MCVYGVSMYGKHICSNIGAKIKFSLKENFPCSTTMLHPAVSGELQLKNKLKSDIRMKCSFYGIISGEG